MIHYHVDLREQSISWLSHFLEAIKFHQFASNYDRSKRYYFADKRSMKELYNKEESWMKWAEIITQDHAYNEYGNFEVVHTNQLPKIFIQWAILNNKCNELMVYQDGLIYCR